MSRFLAMVSHDVRTSVNGIMGMMSLLADELDARGEQELVRAIRSGTAHFRQLLDDLIDLDRLTSGKFSLNVSPFDPASLFRDCGLFWALVAQDKGLPLRVEIDLDLPGQIMGDALRIRQVADNLLSNAIKFSRTGEIVLRISVASGLHIEVEDQAGGISLDLRARLFDAFEQDGDDALTQGGAGLGLFNARHIVELMGGQIGVHPVTAGSRFWFTVPFRHVPVGLLEDASTTLPAAEQEQSQASHFGPQLRVLLVEDVKTNQIIAEAHLAALGCDVVSVGDGCAAVDLVRSREFDVIFLDLFMPQMDGAEAARAIRALPGARGQIPIIVLSGCVLDEDIAPMLAAGVNGLVSKPFSGEDLARALGAIFPELVLRIGGRSGR